MTAYYNEIDPYAAEWLRNLITARHIAPGDVDTRSIEDVTPDDLRSYTQCHFFAGIGVWSHALRRAGWPDDRAVWTGSCPCQPFSAAGKGAGFADERHLWPAWYYLVRECRPHVVFGEQVASKDGLGWLDLVHTDMEAAHYAIAAVDLCAAGIGAPHIRQRLWFVAEGVEHATSDGRIERGTEPSRRCAQCGRGVSRVVDANGRNTSAKRQQPSGQYGLFTEDGGVMRLAHTDGERLEEQELQLRHSTVELQVGHLSDTRTIRVDGTTHDRWASPLHGSWRTADWVFCRDGKWRPVEPGTFPLAHGIANRVGRLRAYGNAIVAPLAETFIRAYLDTLTP